MGWERGERPNILNTVAWRNYLATFDSQHSQQLATLTVIRSCHRSRVVLMLSVCRNALQSCLFQH